MRLLHALFTAMLLISTVTLAETAPGDGTKSTQCGPSPGGSPCGGSGPASQGNVSGTNQGAGNPINVITGNKHQTEVDLPALPGVLGLEIVRHYNSAYSDERAPNGILGRGWKLSYETDLYSIGNTLQIVQADGTRVIFVRDPKNPSHCATNDPSNGKVAINGGPRGAEYTWTWPNGRKLSFNSQGKLTQITAPTGEFVSLTRDLTGALVKVTDPQGRSLILAYPQRNHNHFSGVTQIASPVGHFGYAYGSAAPKRATANPRDLLANLVRVDLPDGSHRHYHYEDPAHPTLLTGISAQGGGAQAQRLSTWAYDNLGRGILSYKGPAPKPGQPGIEQVRLEFAAPGKTILTNSLGQKTTYTHAIIGGEYRLLEVRGAGCASCGDANVKYGYDKLGRLTEQTKLDDAGRPILTTRTERDGQGRVVRISSVTYRNGKAKPAQLQVRYEYEGDSAQPSLIARPSVVAGKEHQIRIAYNAAGQILSVTETGFRPAIDGTPVASIKRGTTYAYVTINGRSLLSAIDGPLRNGPKSDPSDSDVTRIEWDGRGNAVVAMVAPGGLKSTVHYDPVGLISEVRDAQGFRTTFTYDAATRLVRTASHGADWAQTGIKPIVQSYRYDALGNQIESGSGGNGDEPYRPQTRQAFDVAGRLLWQAEALGILKRASYDSEGKLLSSTVQTRSFEQTERYRYDELNRLIQVADNTGSVRNVVYDQRGSAPTHAPSAFRILKDDFGREVMVASASHGALIKQYDPLDRLVEQIDDRGNAQRYAYDLAGHRIAHTVTPKAGAAQTTTWRYEAGRLVETIDPTQRERIAYNERGLPASKIVTLNLANGGEAVQVTRYAYNADGSLASQSLPDGTKLLYERNGQGQVVALHRQTSPWTLFGWGRQTLVKDLERDLIGLRHVTYGNGIQGQWQRSKEGVLARVVYTGAGARPNGAVRAELSPGIEPLLNAILPAAHAQTPVASNKLPGALGLPADPQALFDARLLYDDAGNVLLQKQQGQGPQQTQAYAYDGQSQLIAAQSTSPTTAVKVSSAASAASVWRYHYDRSGNRVLAQENVPASELGRTRKASYDSASGAMTWPKPDREYVWDAQGRLQAIRQGDADLARYRYNHRGLRIEKQTASGTKYTLYNDQRQRIADLDAKGRITRQYIWLADQLIATLDARQPKDLQAPADGSWQALTQTIQTLWSSLTGNEDRLAFVHVNHLGAPIAATDASGQAIWQADYAPYGGLIRTSTSANSKPAYTLALRLPGQWEDAESGLYYNDFRYYDPRAGRYLSPDPLGRVAEALGSPNAYAYVNNNPLSYIDPWGLILFAFDGTNNSNPPPGVDDFSNVYKFYLAYDATQDGPKWYMNGVGRPDQDSGIGTGWLYNATLDAGNGYTARDRVTYMLNQLDNYMQTTAKQGDIVNIDIVGFSRGAAMARDFANKAAQRLRANAYKASGACVNLRFLGLWDTVAQFGANGAGNGLWQLAIPAEVKNVYQAVALNEHRYLFPGESIGRGVQRGFIGSHADIGGSYGTGDLSDVALNWIYEQAKASGIKMKTWSATGHDEWRVVTNPVMHDKSNGTEDRDFCLRANNEVWANNCQEQKAAMPGGMTWSQTNMFRYSYLNPQLDADGVSKITGYVNMEGYAKWLKQNYGFTVQYQ